MNLQAAALRTGAEERRQNLVRGWQGSLPRLGGREIERGKEAAGRQLLLVPERNNVVRALTSPLFSFRALSYRQLQSPQFVPFVYFSGAEAQQTETWGLFCAGVAHDLPLAPRKLR